MRSFSCQICSENQSTHFMFKNFFPGNRAVYEIMRKNMVERGRTQIAIWHVRFGCWITKAKGTNSEYVILITFQQQRWLRKRASLLRLYIFDSLVGFHSLKLCIKAPGRTSPFIIPTFHFARCNIDI